MAVNKIVYNTEDGARTLIDLTNDSVTPETLAKGVTAHDASGEMIVGTMKRSEDLDTVLTEQEALITELKKVLAGKASGGDSGDSMVGLWEFNEVLELYDFNFYFNFKLPRLGDELFTNLFVDSGDLYCANDEVEHTMYSGGWDYPIFRLMALTEEPEDAEAKAWVKANARKLTYDECYAEGEKAILSTYVNWSVSTTSSSCVVDFYNDCDYYAHIYVDIYENVSGEYHSEQFVLAPYDSYSISTEEMGWQIQSAEWQAAVAIEGFSKDGEM